MRNRVTWPWRFVRGLGWPGRGLVALSVVVVAMGVFTGVQFLTAVRLTDVTPADGALLNAKEVVIQTALPRFTPGEAELVVLVDGGQVPASAVEQQNGALRVKRPLAEGKHSVTVELRSGNIFARHLTRSWSFTVDTTAPTVTLVSPTPPEAVGQKDSTLRLGFSEPVKATLTIDGTELPLQTTELTAQTALDLTEGKHAFKLSVTDAAGNPAVKEWTAWADYTPPQVSVTGLPKGSTKTNSANLTITAKDSVPESMVVEATIDGKAVVVKEQLGAKPAALVTTTTRATSATTSPPATTATTKKTTSTTKKTTTTTAHQATSTTVNGSSSTTTKKPTTTTTKKPTTTTTKKTTTTTKPATTTTAAPVTTTTAAASAGGPVYAVYRGTPLHVVLAVTGTATTTTVPAAASSASTPGSRTYVIATGAMAEGVHRLTLTVRDGGGHSVKKDETFVVDSTETLGKHELTVGAKGADVTQLQSILIAKKLLTGKATGAFDEATADVVVKFRTDRQLEAIPLVDRDVLSRLLGSVKIDVSERKLYLYSEGKVVKTYGVAIGMPQYPTPTGDFSIISKVYHPTWTPPPSPWAAGAEPIPPGPDNPLGTRWIGLSTPSVGIHGTPQDYSIGTAASHGCIRMHIPEVEALFEMIYVGTPVSIVP